MAARAWAHRRQRLSRGLGDRLHSIREQEELKVPSARERARARRKDVIHQAQEEGIQPEYPPKSYTAAVAAVWTDKAELDTVGWLTYQLLSAFSHGTLYALFQMLTPVEDPEGRPLHAASDGQFWTRLGTTAEREAMGVLVALYPYGVAATRWMRWSGQYAEEWDRYVAEVTRPFWDAIPSAPDDQVCPQA